MARASIFLCVAADGYPRLGSRLSRLLKGVDSASPLYSSRHSPGDREVDDACPLPDGLGADRNMRAVSERARRVSSFDRSSALRVLSVGSAMMLLIVGLFVGPAAAGSSCSGVQVRPGDNLQRKIDSRPQATTFCLAKGTYRLRKGVHVKSYDRIIGAPGAVLDGQLIAIRG